MLSKIYFRVLIEVCLFAKAVALDKNNSFSRDLKAWAYYRLGMYRTVANIDNLKSKGVFAKIVSHAACGEFEVSEKLLADFTKDKKNRKYFVSLANALSLYMPKQALLLVGDKVEPLHSSILLKLENVEEANLKLKQIIEGSYCLKNPEVLLYYSNSEENISPKKHLENLNRYLGFFNIPAVKLQDYSIRLNINNVACDFQFKYNKAPLVTILMTVFNTEDMIASSVQSVLNQTYTNLELIIINDASTDNTRNILEEYLKIDKRIRVINLSTNVGTYVAKNIGLMQAKGHFITCHDSDDWSHPLKLQRQISPMLKNNRIVATISDWVRIDEDGRYYARPVYSLARMNPSSLLFRKDVVVDSMGFWDCVRTGADSEFIARLKNVFGRFRVKRIREPLTFGSHRKNSLMTSAKTGYSERGMSKQRLQYWESWSSWHIRELRKEKPNFFIKLLSDRRFEAPKSIIVDASIGDISLMKN